MEKGMMEDEMVGCMSITDSMDMSLRELRELVMGREGLVYCGSWSRKESDTTERLN